jgi:type IX secretion system PorP/SprF family membrane protein
VRRLIILLSVFTCFILKGFGQSQLPPAISQYMFNPMSSNPAYAGFYDMATGSNLFRGQVGGIGDFNLFTNTLNFHSSLPIDKMGAGVNITYDQVGITRVVNMDFALSYKLSFGPNKLSFGAQGTIFSGKNDFNLLEYQDNGYKDSYTPSNVSAITKPNFGMGVMYSGRKFFGGFSIPRLFSIVEENQFVLKNSNTENYNTRYQPYYTASLGKIIHVKDKFELKPSFMSKYVSQVGLLLDANFSMLYNETIWTGISIRNSIQRPDQDAKRVFSAFNTLGLMAQAQISDKFKAGFSYDVMLNLQSIRSQKLYKAPFEIMVSYNLAIFEEQGVHTFLY